MLEKRQQLPQGHFSDADYFIYCLEAVPDIETDAVTEAQKSLELISSPNLGEYGLVWLRFSVFWG